MTRPAGAILGLGALLLATTGLGLVLLQAGHDRAFIALAVMQGVLHAGAVLLVLRHGLPRRALLVALGGALAMRALLLPVPPLLSTDAYRYVWDGRVQAAGVNPYRHVPADPALEPLRDAAIYPEINRKDYAVTIYPPVAQALFLAVTRIGESITAMKLAMVGAEMAALLLVIALLRRAGQDPGRALIYAWHPLPVWEFAGNGHVDAAMIALVLLAIWLTARGGRAATGIALAAAALVKPFALALTPVLWRRGDLRLPIAGAVTVTLAYIPYLGVGRGVLGFLPGYVEEEGLASGDGLWPLWLLRHLVPLPTLTYLALAAAALVGLGIALGLRPDRPAVAPGPMLLLAGALSVALSPHFPWYLAWLLALACLAPSLPVLWLATASPILYLPLPFGVTGSIVYGGFLALALLDRRHGGFPLLQERTHVVSNVR